MEHGVLTINSAVGSVKVDDLGRTLMHEHLFTVETELAEYAPELAWNGSREDRIVEAIKKLTQLKSLGIDTFVDMNVLGLGRSMPDVLAVAEKVEMNIVLATGVYPQHGLPGAITMRTPGKTADGKLDDVLADLFIRDIREGIAGTNVKAALIKGYTDKPLVTPVIDRCLRAVAFAHRETGVPINTHTDPRAEAGLEQLRVFAEEGVELSRVVIGHSGDTLDLDYLRRIMDQGAMIASDRFGLYFRDMPDLAQRVEVIVTLVDQGYGDRIVLGHDTHCYADYDFPGGLISRETVPDWVHTHLVEQVLPALRARGVSDEQIDQMLIGNPRKIFATQGAY
jgi:phosphotriesterase-related protein